MRTTLDVESDVLDAARALAVARGVSVGAALSNWHGGVSRPERR